MQIRGAWSRQPANFNFFVKVDPRKGKKLSPALLKFNAAETAP